MNQQTSTRQWLTRAEVATEFGVSPRCVDSMRADGRLTAYQLGPRVVRFKRSEVDAAFTPMAVD
jgi:excisionase family DNA binding protein